MKHCDVRLLPTADMALEIAAVQLILPKAPNLPCDLPAQSKAPLQ
jgi:hypothetical protein